MFFQRTAALIMGACLLAAPLYAKDRGRPAGNQGGAGGNAIGSRAGMPFGRGARAGGPVGWNAFHHDTSPARVSPHRYGATNFPRPNSWHGNVHAFDLDRWHGGQWQHISHNGRLGWWWTVGPDWYFFDAPVYPYPDLYTPYNQPFGWWYWCDSSQEYYPYVTSCAVPWESVMPRE